MYLTKDQFETLICIAAATAVNITVPPDVIKELQEECSELLIQALMAGNSAAFLALKKYCQN